MDPRAPNRRDTGLAMIRRINRWLIAGAIGLSGVVSVAAARSFHGRGTTDGTRAATTPASSAGAPSRDDGGTDLQPPGQAPAPASAGPAVTSGGS